MLAEDDNDDMVIEAVATKKAPTKAAPAKAPAKTTTSTAKSGNLKSFFGKK